MESPLPLALFLDNQEQSSSMCSLIRLAVSSICLTLCCSATQAQITSDKTTLNNENVTISVNFPTALHGDLYIATLFLGQLLFFGENASIATQPMPLITNSDFSASRTVLTINSTGVPSGVYPIYQVLTLSGASPLEPNNWLTGLSQISLEVNMPRPAKSGLALYESMTCANSECHTSNPKKNINKILNGTSLAAIRLSITLNPITMGRFAGSSDENLQAIADYLQTFK